MKTHSTNYFNSFIAVAEDCPVASAEIPGPRKGVETIASLQYRILKDKPYVFTSDEVLFEVSSIRRELLPEEREAAKQEFFSKGQACFRASPLTKRYGWGVHFDEEGRMALYPRESEEYERLCADPGLERVRAIRNRKA